MDAASFGRALQKLNSLTKGTSFIRNFYIYFVINEQVVYETNMAVYNRLIFLAPYFLKRCELSEVGVRRVEQHPFSAVFGYVGALPAGFAMRRWSL